MRKKIWILLLMALAFSKVFALTVYDPANHQQNMQNYQMLILQKLEQVKTATENGVQTIQQAKQLEHDVTNLESLAGTFLGQESEFLVQAFEDLNAINKNSQSILRESETIDTNFDKVFLDTDRLKGLNSEELARETYKIAKYRKNNIKDNLKTATKVIELNEKDSKNMARYMSQTDGARGNLQASMATKKGIDQLNNRVARLTDLQAKAIIIEAEKQAEQETIKLLEEEQVRRMMEMSPEDEKLVKRVRQSGKFW